MSVLTSRLVVMARSVVFGVVADEDNTACGPVVGHDLAGQRLCSGPGAAQAVHHLGHPPRRMASTIPDEYVNYACGTNGGPPSRPLPNFAAFKTCKPDADGLHEVYFEYDDEQEYVARAMQNRDGIMRYGGTTSIRISDRCIPAVR